MNVEDSNAYKLEFEERTDYLYAYVSGDKASLEMSKQYWHKIAEECRRTKSKKVLIVEDIKENVSTNEMYEFACELPTMGFIGIKIAFVDQYIEQRTLNELGELVATNRGGYGKIFNTVEEAEKWLLSK
ncbi:MAG: hypothetical protein M3521_11055 [Acidobacteriota bacterium]|nr:hypothetical protein [Acidobacteriota bacterium]